MIKYKILIIDDEWNMRNLLKIYLKKDGFDVIEASSGRDAVALAASVAHDLVILDIMLPDMDGWQVCQRLREQGNTPILMLTARTDTKDKVHGLKIGADDYLTKPFEPEELIARVFALIRRSSTSPYKEDQIDKKIEFKDLTLYPEGRTIVICNDKLELTPKEFDVLFMLARHPKRVFAREVLLEQLWGFDFKGDTRTIDTHVKNIREKIQRAGLSYNPIQTVWGIGYKFHEQG